MQTFSEWVVVEAFRSVCVPGMREITLPAMVFFNNDNTLYFVPLAMAGAAVGGMLVYWLGRLMAKGFHAVRPDAIPKSFHRIIALQSRRFGIPMLALYAILPLGHLLLFAAGFLRLPAWVVLTGAALGRGLYYLIYGY